MFEPSAVVLYVENLEISSKFYQELFEIEPVEQSPAFHSFTLSNGMSIGLKAMHTVTPPVNKNGSGELVFIVDNNQKVDDLWLTWQKQEITILCPVAQEKYGYTFLAQDPDGNRLRVVSLEK